MEYISSDTNIWMDFHSINKIEVPFLLPIRYIMYREAMRKEIIDPPEDFISKKEYREILMAWEKQVELGRRLPIEEIKKRLNKVK